MKRKFNQKQKQYLRLRVILFNLLLCSVLTSYAATPALRDPTEPLNYQASSQEDINKDIVLTAIITAPTRTVAIINGESVQVGDVVQGYQVLKIEPHAVSLQGPGGTIQLPLVESFIKQPSK